MRTEDRLETIGPVVSGDEGAGEGEFLVKEFFQPLVASFAERAHGRYVPEQLRGKAAIVPREENGCGLEFIPQEIKGLAIDFNGFLVGYMEIAQPGDSIDWGRGVFIQWL